MLAQQNLELVVYSKAKLLKQREKAEKARRAQELAIDRAMQLEKQRAEQLEQQRVDEAAAARRFFAYMRQKEALDLEAVKAEPELEPGSDGWLRLIRTVYIDRRKSVPGEVHVYDSDSLPSSLIDRPNSDELEHLGIRINVKEDQYEGGGTYAVIQYVWPGMLASCSGSGANVVRQGDKILRLQGVRLSQLTPNQTHAMLASSRLELVLQDERFTEKRSSRVNTRVDRTLQLLEDNVDKVLSSVSEKAASWWSAGSKAFTEFAVLTTDSTRRFVDGPKPGPAGSDSAKPDNDEIDELPDMFHDYAPCPVVRGLSDIANGKTWCKLWSSLPETIQFKAAHLVFSTAEDGSVAGPYLRSFSSSQGLDCSS